MLYSLMPVIKLQQQYSLRNTKVMTMRSKKFLLLNFLHSFLTHNSGGALLLKKVMQFAVPLRNGGTTLKMQKSLLKSDAKSLQIFLNGRTDNLKLDRWSLKLQGRNIQVEHIPGYKNKVADSR